MTLSFTNFNTPDNSINLITLAPLLYYLTVLPLCLCRDSIYYFISYRFLQIGRKEEERNGFCGGGEVEVEGYEGRKRHEDSCQFW